MLYYNITFVVVTLSAFVFGWKISKQRQKRMCAEESSEKMKDIICLLEQGVPIQYLPNGEYEIVEKRKHGRIIMVSHIPEYISTEIMVVVPDILYGRIQADKRYVFFIDERLNEVTYENGCVIQFSEKTHSQTFEVRKLLHR